MSIVPPLQTFDDFERETTRIIKPFQSKFGAVPWSRIGQTGNRYEWLIKGILPCRERILIYGESQSGKSFEHLRMAMHMACGVEYQGRKVKRVGVVYCAFEGGKGFENRVEAYKIQHRLSNGDEVPFTLLTKRADLFSDAQPTEDLIEEILFWGDEMGRAYGVPLGYVGLDTFSAATPGMKENASEDVSRVLARIDRIASKVKVAVGVVHHKPKGGDTPRGHGSLTADFETTIEIGFIPDAKDDRGRPLRFAKVSKQREGVQGLEWQFTLPAVDLYRDEDGDMVTSCVATPYEGDPAPRGAQPFRPTDVQRAFFRALVAALTARGAPPPPHLRLPRTILKAVPYDEVKIAFLKDATKEESDTTALRAKLKKQLQRARGTLTDAGIIAGEDGMMWWTGRPVAGFRPTGLVGIDYDASSDDPPFDGDTRL